MLCLFWLFFNTYMYMIRYTTQNTKFTCEYTIFVLGCASREIFIFLALLDTVFSSTWCPPGRHYVVVTVRNKHSILTRVFHQVSSKSLHAVYFIGDCLVSFFCYSNIPNEASKKRIVCEQNLKNRACMSKVRNSDFMSLILSQLTPVNNFTIDLTHFDSHS